VTTIRRENRPRYEGGFDDLLGSGQFYAGRDFAQEATIVGRCRAHDRRSLRGRACVRELSSIRELCTDQIRRRNGGKICCVQRADCVKSIARNERPVFGAVTARDTGEKIMSAAPRKSASKTAARERARAAAAAALEKENRLLDAAEEFLSRDRFDGSEERAAAGEDRQAQR
jgi:hypothetical protein